jgi:hypothetical protein
MNTLALHVIHLIIASSHDGAKVLCAQGMIFNVSRFAGTPSRFYQIPHGSQHQCRALRGTLPEIHVSLIFLHTTVHEAWLMNRTGRRRHRLSVSWGATLTTSHAAGGATDQS